MEEQCGTMDMQGPVARANVRAQAAVREAEKLREENADIKKQRDEALTWNGKLQEENERLKQQVQAQVIRATSEVTEQERREYENRVAHLGAELADCTGALISARAWRSRFEAEHAWMVREIRRLDPRLAKARWGC